MLTLPTLYGELVKSMCDFLTMRCLTHLLSMNMATKLQNWERIGSCLYLEFELNENKLERLESNLETS